MLVIVSVLLRLLSIKVFLDGVSLAFSALARSAGNRLDIFVFVSVALYFLCAAGIWYIAPILSRLLVGRQDPATNHLPITTEDLHRIAFVTVGLYLIGTSFGQTLNWLYFSLIISGDRELTAEDRKNFYRLFQYATQLGIGLFFVLRSQMLASRLCSSSWSGKK